MLLRLIIHIKLCPRHVDCVLSRIEEEETENLKNEEETESSKMGEKFSALNSVQESVFIHSVM
jgi:hypothetical protein